ncbi:Oidioi.mRNA.OKI2018_I69.chr1.g2115.t1.cds [Oikopleura dioica]|uniref:Oidioi.mRNA.OKI2018_I69.chr1.g2115.t1.cds n=1 Tax=Oikopleura dioica TaxID=34765 RepID=A0ABN7SUA1_OIKDI|nr:Oidioi.mRNA.OKI2018_I69.chr1.g2115.t1.cds [Oikopleura dioica]
MKPGRKRDLEECSETPLFYTPSTLETTIPTVMTGECDSRRRKNGRGVTVKCSSCCMFLWIVLMIMIGFLIGSIINTVTSPDYEAGEGKPANALLKMDTQVIDGLEKEVEISEIKEEFESPVGRSFEKAGNSIRGAWNGVVNAFGNLFG